jgi:hypothetical protein
MAKTKQEIAEEKQNREDAKKELKMWLSNDWNLSEETPEYFKIKKNSQTVGGHILVFIIFGWWTIGIANVIYWLASKKTKKILK